MEITAGALSLPLSFQLQSQTMLCSSQNIYIIAPIAGHITRNPKPVPEKPEPEPEKPELEKPED